MVAVWNSSISAVRLLKDFILFIYLEAIQPLEAYYSRQFLKSCKTKTTVSQRMERKELKALRVGAFLLLDRRSLI